MRTLPITKLCTCCRRELPLESFHKAAGCRFGRRPQCKDCIHEKRVADYAKNADRNRAYSRAYYAENADKVIAYQAEYSKHNRRKIAVRSKVWRAANDAHLKKAKRADYLSKRDHYLALTRKYHRENPQYGRISVIRRRARLQDAPGECTAAQWIAKCEYFGFCCYLCHRPLTIKTLETEHRIPLSRGGSNWPANLAPACKECNKRKHKMTEKEYRAEIP